MVWGRSFPAGCEELLKALTKKAPAVHVFGHVHNGTLAGKFAAIQLS